MSKPAIIFITTGLKLALLAITGVFTLLDKLHSVKKQVSNSLLHRPEPGDAERASINKVGAMRMSDGQH